MPRRGVTDILTFSASGSLAARRGPVMTNHDAHPDLALLREHDAWLRALTRQLVRDEETARDVAQETWLAALQQRPADDRPLRAWLTTVARRTATRLLLRDQRRRDREQRLGPEDPLPGPAQLLERTESIRRLTAALTALPEPRTARACCCATRRASRPMRSRGAPANPRARCVGG